MTRTRKTKPYYQSIGDAQSGRAMGQWSIDRKRARRLNLYKVAGVVLLGLLLVLAARGVM